MDRLRSKTLLTARRNFQKVPYTTEGGVFDDLTEANISWWTNGFWAGILWQLYGAYGDSIFREAAESVEEKLDRVFMMPQGMDHDSGFRWLPTSGASYTLTGSEASKNRLILAANNLAGRFNPVGNYIRAWNDGGDGATAGWAKLTESWPNSVIRAKGMVWYRDEPEMSYIFEQAGRQIQEKQAGTFLASAPKDQQETVLSRFPAVKRIWDEKYGDRMIKLVFIGKNMDKTAIEASLDACLAD